MWCQWATVQVFLSIRQFLVSFPFDYGPSANRVGFKLKGKKRTRNLHAARTDETKLARSSCCTGVSIKSCKTPSKVRQNQNRQSSLMHAVNSLRKRNVLHVLFTMTLQKVDRPNTTPIGPDKNTLTFKALLERVRLSKTSLFCMKEVEGLYRG